MSLGVALSVKGGREAGGRWDVSLGVALSVERERVDGVGGEGTRACIEFCFSTPHSFKDKLIKWLGDNATQVKHIVKSQRRRLFTR